MWHMNYTLCVALLLSFFFLYSIYRLKPGILFQQEDGTWKTFVLGGDHRLSDNTTPLSMWVVTIVISVFSYMIALQMEQLFQKSSSNKEVPVI